MACATLLAMQLRRSRLATLLALLVAVPLSAQDVCGRSATHRWRSTSRSPTGRSPHHVPQVRLQSNGSAPRRFGMDTGSTGIVVSAELYIPAPGDTLTTDPAS